MILIIGLFCQTLLSTADLYVEVSSTGDNTDDIFKKATSTIIGRKRLIFFKPKRGH